MWQRTSGGALKSARNRRVTSAGVSLRTAMGCAIISLEDCIAICGLEAIEVQAIAEHEHIPEISAAALADYLLHQVGGAERIRKMILDDIRTAIEAGRGDYATELSMALHHFLERHPEI